MQKKPIKRFTPEELTVLKANPFTYKVDSRRIYYTLEFKNLFLSHYETGESSVIEIFESHGYDVKILGENRMYCFASGLLRRVKAGEVLTEVPLTATQEKPVNVDYNTMPSQQSISAMQREIAYLRQQLEFVKKITELDKDRKSRK